MPEHGGNGALPGATQPTAMDISRQDPLIGQVLDGRYRIESVLGEGGMGIVYKAVHTTLRKPLAIKVLRPEVSKNEQIVQRFKQEAQSASQIGNQHIIDISDFGELADGSTYFVMEFLNGQSLTSALDRAKERKEKIGTSRTIYIAKQLCAALGAAHEIGIVHRDMKPDNVQLVQRGDDSDFVKVLDFGIAKVGGSTSKLTQAGQVFGTPHYMSPEQCAGTNVDHRTDIYAVGVMLYEMATGGVPFDADNLMGILTKHLYENPIPPHELPPPVDVPPALEAVILKCLSKKPDLRYQTMGDLQDDLEAVEAGLTPKAVVDHVQRATHASQTAADLESPGRMTVGQGVPGVPGKRPVGLIIGIVVLLIGGGAGAYFAMGSKPAEPEHVVKPAADTPPATVPPPAANPTPPTTPAAPTQITIKSDPAGAELYRSNALIGNTPFTLAKPKDGEQLELELRMSGYENRTFSVSSLTQDELNVSLSKEKEKPSSGGKHGSTHNASNDRPGKGKNDKGQHRVESEVLDPWD
jgi:serine/threonine-protein kinase